MPCEVLADMAPLQGPSEPDTEAMVLVSFSAASASRLWGPDEGASCHLGVPQLLLKHLQRC